MGCLKDDRKPEDCKAYDMNDGVHCFTVKACSQASALCVKLGGKAGAIALTMNLCGEEEGAPLKDMLDEVDSAISAVAAVVMAVLAKPMPDMLWLLADAVIELFGTRSAKLWLPDWFKMPTELGNLLGARIEQLEVKPDHMYMLSVERDSYLKN